MSAVAEAVLPQPTVARRTFQAESFASFYQEAEHLIREHYHEIAHYQDIQLSVDVTAYCRIEAAGGLRVYTARIDGVIVGYALFVVAMNPHYSSSKQAKQDVLYVAPEYRQKMLGYRLIQYCEDELRKEGVQAVYHHSKVSHPELANLLRGMGYETVDLVHAKRLDGGQ